MYKVFEFSHYDIFYQRCILASIAHAIMVGKFTLLASEQSWDGNNYNFQNMEGIRGIMSFSKDNMVCVIQNDKDYLESEEEIIDKMFSGADDKVCNLARTEALQYMLINDEVKAASATFWCDKIFIYSNQTENKLLDSCGNILNPYLFSEEDAIKYWINYYEMNSEQINMMKKIYNLRITATSNLLLSKIIKEELIVWFGNIDDCLESFSEIKIYFE